jgi:hypothetical protein
MEFQLLSPESQAILHHHKAKALMATNDPCEAEREITRAILLDENNPEHRKVLEGFQMRSKFAKGASELVESSKE